VPYCYVCLGDNSLLLCSGPGVVFLFVIVRFMLGFFVLQVCIVLESCIVFLPFLFIDFCVLEFVLLGGCWKSGGSKIL